jgi:hypothetical protein
VKLLRSADETSLNKVEACLVSGVVTLKISNVASIQGRDHITALRYIGYTTCTELSTVSISHACLRALPGSSLGQAGADISMMCAGQATTLEKTTQP